MAHIVLMAEERSQVAHIARALPEAGYDATVLEASAPERAMSMASEADLIIAAVNDDPARMYEMIRAATPTSDVPVLMVMDPKHAPGMRWQSAADDFVVKPGNPQEVAARVKRIFDARTPARAQAYPLQAGDVAVDPCRFDAQIADRPMALTLQEFRLLHTLIRHTGSALSRSELLKKAWNGSSTIEGSRTVDVHIRRLRAKLEKSATTRIQTVSGIGYRLEIDKNSANA